jgi:hypothetical protein
LVDPNFKTKNYYSYVKKYVTTNVQKQKVCLGAAGEWLWPLGEVQNQKPMYTIGKEKKRQLYSYCSQIGSMQMQSTGSRGKIVDTDEIALELQA